MINSNHGVELKKFRIGFDGGPFGTPCLVELCLATFATNPPGTNSAVIPIQQAYGRTIPPTGFVAGFNWTVEPTVLTPIDAWDLPPNGVVIYDFPANDAPDLGGAGFRGFVLRLTPTAGCAVRSTLWFERI